MVLFNKPSYLFRVMWESHLLYSSHENIVDYNNTTNNTLNMSKPCILLFLYSLLKR